ncbi:MAG: NAD(P)H-dependent oxidoreductase [Flavobacteriaceae bacterium]|nr:NAD(P)H-dependent oxidoreductase [Flavobacteriaceae bacterium]
MASNIIEKLNWRYATKKFDATRQLSEEKVQILKDAFNLTATSYGLQPLKMVVIQNKELQRRLVAASMDQEQVYQASHVLVLCIELELPSQYIKQHFNRVEDLRNTPREILDPFEDSLIDSFSAKKEEDVSLWMAKQAYIALGNLMTVCALEEIDSCPMEGFVPDQYDDILGLTEKGLRSVLVLPVGYRADDDFFSELKKVRRGTSEVIIEM